MFYKSSKSLRRKRKYAVISINFFDCSNFLSSPLSLGNFVPCFKEQKIDYKVKNLNKLNKRLVSTKSTIHKYLQLF